MSSYRCSITPCRGRGRGKEEVKRRGEGGGGETAVQGELAGKRSLGRERGVALGGCRGTAARHTGCPRAFSSCAVTAPTPASKAAGYGLPAASAAPNPREKTAEATLCARVRQPTTHGMHSCGVASGEGEEGRQERATGRRGASKGALKEVSCSASAARDAGEASARQSPRQRQGASEDSKEGRDRQEGSFRGWRSFSLRTS